MRNMDDKHLIEKFVTNIKIAKQVNRKFKK